MSLALGLGLGLGLGGADPANHSITSVSDDGDGNALFHCGGPHGLSVLNVIDLSLSGAYGNIADAVVGTVPSPTTFLAGVSFLGNATGTWAAS
jgi:hypothetical protein